MPTLWWYLRSDTTPTAVNYFRLNNGKWRSQNRWHFLFRNNADLLFAYCGLRAYFDDTSTLDHLIDLHRACEHCVEVYAEDA